MLRVRHVSGIGDLWSCGLRSITCSDYSALLEAVRARMAETGITYATLDHIAGTSAGYAQKILGPRPVKTFGPISFSIFGALALRVTVEVDEEQAERMRPRWVPRETGPIHLVCHAGRGRAAPGEAQDSISTPADCPGLAGALAGLLVAAARYQRLVERHDCQRFVENVVLAEPGRHTVYRPHAKRRKH